MSPKSMGRILEGQFVLVTGAGQGNGRAIALGLADVGAKVVVTDIRVETAESTAVEIRANGGESWSFTHDVASSKASIALADQVGREIGLINVLVNNAGIIIREGVNSSGAVENFRRVIDVNLNGS